MVIGKLFYHLEPGTIEKGLPLSQFSYWVRGPCQGPAHLPTPSSPPSPAQGLEIVNPQAAEKKVAEANQKYFSSMAEFLKVKGEKSGIMST